MWGEQISRRYLSLHLETTISLFHYIFKWLFYANALYNYPSRQPYTSQRSAGLRCHVTILSLMYRATIGPNAFSTMSSSLVLATNVTSLPLASVTACHVLASTLYCSVYDLTQMFWLERPRVATDVTRYECKRSTWIQRDVESGSAIHPARLPSKSSSSWKRREREAVLTSEWEESAENEERGRRERRGRSCEHPKKREKIYKNQRKTLKT